MFITISDSDQILGKLETKMTSQSSYGDISPCDSNIAYNSNKNNNIYSDDATSVCQNGDFPQISIDDKFVRGLSKSEITPEMIEEPKNFVQMGTKTICTIDSVSWFVCLTESELQFFNVSQDENRPRIPTPAFKYQLADITHFKVLEQDLMIYFIRRLHDHKWKLGKPLRITNFPSKDAMNQWVHRLDSICNSSSRPKTLHFIINPVSGNKEARKYFAKVVEPLLKQVGVTYTVTVTERSGHATELVRTLDISAIDGVVALGGDGTVNEMINGFQNFSSKSKDVAKLPKRLGTIPCGTSNNLAYAVHGTDDKLTALLHTLLGDDINLDMMTARNQSDELVGISMSTIAYGFIGDSIKASEKYRKLPGTLGYTISFIQSIQKMKKYPAQLQFRIPAHTDVTPKSSPKCISDCEHCANSPTPNPESDEMVCYSEPKIFGLQIHNHPGACKLCPRGASANAHLGDGCMDVLIIRDITKDEAIKMLKDAGKKEGENLPFDFIEAIRVSQVKLTGDPNKLSCWILDGEVISEPELTVNIHKQVIPFFGRGIEVDSEKSVGCFSVMCGC